MAKQRDWAADVQGMDIEFIKKDGDYIYCSKEGFIFKCYRTSWPPTRLTPEVCITPTELYKFQVRQVHGDLYGLEKVVYTKADKDVVATCSIHGDFTIRAANLKSGKGCGKCGNIAGGKANTLSTEDFINKAKTVHGNHYDYSLATYVHNSKNLTIICPVHGEFEQWPTNHLSGKGCKRCAIENNSQHRKLSQDEIIQRFSAVHNDRYDYTKVIYNGDAHGDLEIICKDHGSFLQTYANHYHNSQGCPECAKIFSPRLRSGFVASSESKNGYASLYLINCFDDIESFYKIGITTKPLKHRFAGKDAMPYSYFLEYLIIGDAEWLWDFEKELHKEYKTHSYLPLKEFGGRYECFSDIDVDGYKKLVNTIG